MDQGASHPNNQYHKTDSDAVWADGFEDDFQGKGKAAGGGEGGEEGEGDGASDSKQLAAKKKRLPFVFFKYSLSFLQSACAVLFYFVLCCVVLCCSVLSWFIRRHYHRYH